MNMATCSSSSGGVAAEEEAPAFYPDWCCHTGAVMKTNTQISTLRPVFKKDAE